MEIQYVLTKAEYEDLKRKTDNRLQALCVYMAENVPVKFWGRSEPEIWGCCLHGTKDISHYDYCDECIAQNHCPEQNKRWSK